MKPGQTAKLNPTYGLATGIPQKLLEVPTAEELKEHQREWERLRKNAQEQQSLAE